MFDTRNFVKSGSSKLIYQEMSKRGMLFKLDSSNYKKFLLLLVLWTVITLELRHPSPTKENNLKIGKDRDQISQQFKYYEYCC